MIFLHSLDTVCATLVYLVNGLTPVPKDALTASTINVLSFMPNLDYGPYHGRLHNQYDELTNNAGRWKPQSDDSNPFIQVGSLYIFKFIQSSFEKQRKQS